MCVTEDQGLIYIVKLYENLKFLVVISSNYYVH